MRSLIGPSRRLAILFAATALISLGCGTTADPPLFDPWSLPQASPAEESIPSMRAATSAPRILVLPLADRSPHHEDGPLHNAVDDLIRRDLMAVPTLAVYPGSVFQVPLEDLRANNFRSLASALKYGSKVGATHVIIGEVVGRENQVAVELDIVDVASQSVLQVLRAQAEGSRMRPAIQTLRTEVLQGFGIQPGTIAGVPGRTPDTGVLTMLGSGQDRLLNGDLSGAMLDLSLAAEPGSEFSEAWVGMAEGHTRLQAPSQAQGAYAQAIEHDPANVEAYWRYALLLMREQKKVHSAALRVCQAATRRAPLFGHAHLTLGTLWMEQGNPPHADKHFAVAEALLPQSAWPAFHRAQVVREGGDRTKAERLLRRAKALGPKEGSIRSALGVVLSEQGDHSQALEEFIAASQLEPQNAQFLYYVGHEYRVLGEEQNALVAFRAAAAMAYIDNTVRRDLGIEFLNAGQTRDAVSILGAAMAKSPADPELALLYARALFEAGRENRIRRSEYFIRAERTLKVAHGPGATEDQRARARELQREIDERAP